MIADVLEVAALTLVLAGVWAALMFGPRGVR